MSLRTLILRSSVHQRVAINFVPIVIQKNYYNDYKGHGDGNSNRKYFMFGAVAALGIATVNSCFGGSVKKKEDIKPGEPKPKLPTYRLEEVMKHNTKEDCWVMYKGGVYNITKFVKSHPGGEQILEAAGLNMEPFWNVYSMHHTQQVYEMLEELRIGNLHPDDIVDQSDASLWSAEPSRDPRLLVITPRPFNAETPGDHLIQALDTPNELFFVRQHMPVPEMDAGSHSVHVAVRAGGTEVKKDYSLESLSAMPQHTVRATLMCAGNRRSELNKIRPVKGQGWTTGAIGTACWTGPLLRDVLRECGVDPYRTEGKHVITPMLGTMGVVSAKMAAELSSEVSNYRRAHANSEPLVSALIDFSANRNTFTGADIDAKGDNFSTSIPLHIAMDPNQRIVIALKMNGEELPPDHGYPVRVVIPGVVAFRSVKWLKSIEVSDKESSSHWHTHDYRSFNASVTWETADFSTAPPIYTLPVTAAICDPPNGQVIKLKELKDGMMQVKGYAYSGGGAKIVRVDVSCDGGASWSAAHTFRTDPSPPRQHFSWTLWTADVPVAGKAGKEVELWVKATDSDHNTQPEKPNDIWNIRGLLCNAYHRVKVKIEK